MKGIKLESVQCVKNLGVRIASSFIFSQKKDAAGKTNRMLGFINSNFSFKNKDVILPLYISYLDHIQNMLCSSGCLTIQGYSESRGCPAKIIKSLRNKSYEERLARLNSFSFEKRRIREKNIECFKILDGFTNVDSTNMFSIDTTS